MTYKHVDGMEESEFLQYVLSQLPYDWPTVERLQAWCDAAERDVENEICEAHSDGVSEGEDSVRTELQEEHDAWEEIVAVWDNLDLPEARPMDSLAKKKEHIKRVLKQYDRTLRTLERILDLSKGARKRDSVAVWLFNQALDKKLAELRP